MTRLPPDGQIWMIPFEEILWGIWMVSPVDLPPE